MGLRWGSDHRVRFHPAPLHQPFANPLFPRHRPHRPLSCPPGYRRPQPLGSPSPGPADRVRLREHLAAPPAAEASLQQRQPHLLPPQLGVPLALQAPLVDLPGTPLTSGAHPFTLLVLRRHLDPPRCLFHPQHHQPRQTQPDGDTIVVHLTSFLALARCLLSRLPGTSGANC